MIHNPSQPDIPYSSLNGRGGRPLPAEPTTTYPGSREKLEVLRERASRREELFHPSDATLEGYCGGESIFEQRYMRPR